MQIDFEDLKALVAEKENRQVEFKKSTGQIDRGMETICAFLNTT